MWKKKRGCNRPSCPKNRRTRNKSNHELTRIDTNTERNSSFKIRVYSCPFVVEWLSRDLDERNPHTGVNSGGRLFGVRRLLQATPRLAASTGRDSTVNGTG